IFFFQAEDGIRDRLVTGVQTCALPIYRSCVGPIHRGRISAAEKGIGSSGRPDRVLDKRRNRQSHESVQRSGARLRKRRQTMKKYEGLFILDTAGKEEGIKEVLDKISSEITAAGGKVETVQKMDKRNFTRVADRKHHSGFY